MHLSPVLAELGTYPFVAPRRGEARGSRARGVDVIDFGIGDPREPTDAVHPRRRSSTALPRDDGLPARAGPARAARGDRRLVRAALRRRARPRHARSIPTLGSKEAIFCFAQVVARSAPAGRTSSSSTEPGYPVYERGALFAGAEVVRLPLLEENGFLPGPRRGRRETLGAHRALLGQLPEQPDRRVAPLAFYERARRRSRASTTSSRLRRGVHRALVRRAAARRRSRSPTARTSSSSTRSRKRSSMTGYRSGFVAGDAGGRSRRCERSGRPSARRRRSSSSAPSVAAWGDEAHVERGARRATRASATSCCRVLEREGLRVAGERGDDVPLGRGARRRAVRGVRDAAARARRRRRARLVPRRRPARATSASRSSRPRRSASARPRSSRRCCDDSLSDGRGRSIAGARPAARIVAVAEAACERRRLGRRTSEAKKAILVYFRLRKIEPIEVGPFEYLDKIPLKRDYAALGVRVVPPAVARYGSFLSRGRRADAELRQHRRLGRPAHDGRHVGDGRLVRADRRRRPPLRRRRHRRRARAAAGDAR